MNRRFLIPTTPTNPPFNRPPALDLPPSLIWTADRIRTHLLNDGDRLEIVHLARHSPDCLPDLCTMLIDLREDPKVRSSIALIFGYLSFHRDMSPATPILLWALHDPTIRSSAAVALRLMVSAKTHFPLYFYAALSLASESHDPVVRSQISEALETLKQ